MQSLETFQARRVAADATLIGQHLSIPGLGLLPVNALVVRAREPVLVDTGTAAQRASFLDALRAAIDPADLRWIWITHTDADHVGNLREVLDLAPAARVATNFLGMAKLGLLGLPLDRVHLLNPGQALDVGDRRLQAVQPPVFDAPETMGLFDPRGRLLYTADCFGALLERAASSVEEVGAELRAGLTTWARVDAPWLAHVDRARLAAACDALRALAPARVLGAHLPPAEGRSLDRLIDDLLAACDAPAFVGPDQAQLEASMALPEAA
jgi:flavorubredoxin